MTIYIYIWLNHGFLNFRKIFELIFDTEDKEAEEKLWERTYDTEIGMCKFLLLKATSKRTFSANEKSTLQLASCS